VLIVNRCHSPSFSMSDVEQASAARHEGVSAACDSLSKAALAVAEEEVNWAALNEHCKARLAAETGWGLVVLPMLFREEFGLADVEALSVTLEDAMAGRLTPRRAELRP
jgi:hypothetical protein